ncbi:GntR family transcriptional regulator [Microbacterium sp. 179-I 3D4 NHS]|uniref:GntR family transcriptional regulator n=1 Tax=Microbacterium sp. 179-I 3D4 NHS TaxID=3142381 RepID=UPI00399F3325
MPVMLDEARARSLASAGSARGRDELTPADPHPGEAASTPFAIGSPSGESRRERRFLGEDVFLELGAAIASGVLRDGDVIRDRELAVRMEISRTPVREAILRLQQLGLIEISPSRRTRVAELTNGAARDARRWAGYCGGIAAREAVDRLTPADAEAAISRVHALRAALDAPAAAATAALDLLTFLAARADCAPLHAEVTEGQFALVRALRRMPLAIEERAASRDACQALVDAVIASDGDAAEAAMRAIFGVR